MSNRKKGTACRQPDPYRSNRAAARRATEETGDGRCLYFVIAAIAAAATFFLA